MSGIMGERYLDWNPGMGVKYVIWVKPVVVASIGLIIVA